MHLPVGIHGQRDRCGRLGAGRRGAADGDGEASTAVDGGAGCTEEAGAGPAAGDSDPSCSTIHATVPATAIMMTLPATTIQVIRAGVSRCVGQSSPSSSDHAVCASVSSTVEPRLGELAHRLQEMFQRQPEGATNEQRASARRWQARQVLPTGPARRCTGRW